MSHGRAALLFLLPATVLATRAGSVETPEPSRFVGGRADVRGPPPCILEDDKVTLEGDAVGEWSRGAGSSVRLALGADGGMVQRLWCSKIGGGLIMVYEAMIMEGGAGFAVRLDAAGRTTWKTPLPGVNVGEPAVLGSDLFVSSIGSVGCLDVRTGRFRWRHEGLYRDGMYNSFVRPTLVDSRVVFPAVHADGGFPHEKWPDALEVDRQSGAIVGGFVPVTEKVVAREILRQKELNAIWSYDPVLIGDVTGDGAADFVFSGKAWSKFFVGVVAGPKPSKEGAWVLEFPVARDVQNAVPTQEMRLRLEKPSAFESADTCTTADQSTDCKVEATVRAAAGRGMKGIGLSDDQTDAFHVYWNPIGKRFQYWRR